MVLFEGKGEGDGEQVFSIQNYMILPLTTTHKEKKKASSRTSREGVYSTNEHSNI